MVGEHVFIIDATFLLDDAEKAFLGSAPSSMSEVETLP
jgi:hypothetical protein